MDLSSNFHQFGTMDMQGSLLPHQQQPQHHQQQQQQQQQSQPPRGGSSAGAGDIQGEAEVLDELATSIDLLLRQSASALPPHNLDSFINSLQENSSSVANVQRKLSSMMAVSTFADQDTSMLSPQTYPQNQCEYFDDHDILTPLVSPAMTPSFSYQKHSQSRVSQDLEFSPLSSPAIVPQYPRQQHQHSFLSNNGTNQSQQRMTPQQIYQQYEQLEHAKLMITRRLSELQSQQEREAGLQHQRAHMNHNTNTNISNINTSAPEQPQFSQPHAMAPALAPAPTAMEHPHQGGNVAPGRMLEPATPSSLMNLRTRQQQQQQQQPPMMDDSSQHPSQPLTPPSSSSSSTSSSGTRRLRRSTNSSASTARRSKDVGPKKIRRESASHTSPRTLKPLLISPTLKAGGGSGGGGSGGPNAAPELAPRSSVQDAERILATRSNYQNLMEGKAAALGIAFSPNIRSGLEIRRTAHKAAEQKRRDSLKEWFDRLRREVEDGYVKKQILPSSTHNASKDDGHDAEEEEEEAQTDANGLKPLSKVLLLRYAYEYISSLKNTIQDRDTRMLKLEEENKNLKKKRKAGDSVEDEDEGDDMIQAEQ